MLGLDADGPNPPRQSSVITILPNEVVAKIFTTGTDIWKDHHPRELPFPILVSSVTSHWRQLARNTPSLWAFIIVPMHKDPNFCLLWTSEWLSRSGGLPLSVILDHRINRMDQPIQETSRLISQIISLLVKSCKQRLYRLDISSIFDPDEIKIALEMRDAPHLQQVSLCNWNTLSSRFSGGETSLPWLINLPNLTKLRFQGTILPYISRLTSLTAYNLRLTYDDVQAVFSTSPDLAHLVLQNMIPIAGPVPLNRDLIQLNSLRSLAITSNRSKEPHGVYLFHLLIIPNLTYLEVDGNLQIFSVLESSISSSKIETLRISNNSTFSNQNIPDFKNCPPLTSLQHLQLIRGPAAGLLFKHEPQVGLSRRRSIDLRLYGKPRAADSTNLRLMPLPIPLAEPPKIPWPELRTITFDTLVASDVAELCRFIQLHKGVQKVELSRTAMRHLSGSLRREGDRVYHLPPQLNTPIIKGKEGTKDVPEWLGGLVKVRVFDPQAYGLLDGDRFPFHEMP